jgi:AraC-like DNA-binding protein
MSARIRRRPQPIPWIHGAALRPTFEYLGHLGIDHQRWLERNHLPAEPMDLCRDVFPQHLVGGFVCDVAAANGLPNLANEAAHFVRRARVPWAWSDPTDPTLQSALARTFARSKGLSSTRFRMEFQEASVAIIREQTELPDDAEYLFGSFGMQAVIDLIRSYLGADWQPARIGIPGRIANHRELPMAFQETAFDSLRSQWRLELPLSCLAHGPDRVLTHRRAEQDTGIILPMDDPTFPSVLGRLLQTWMPSEPIDLEQAAEIIRMHPRTLQRQLNHCGMTFSEVREEARFAIARDLLCNTDQPIFEIARQLGYETHSNFSRAFRRIAGIPPNELRKRGVT